MENTEAYPYPRVVLGLDISTACIGVSVVKDDGKNIPEILYLSHKTPKVSHKIKGIEALFLRKQIFEDEVLVELAKEYPITDVVIEEPLLSSNNVNTVATLLRFNGMIAEAVYRRIGVVPQFISSYDARMFSFPELVSLRKYNKRGEEYPEKHIRAALKSNSIVLFGAYPFDIDKKTVMMNMVNALYKDSPITWIENEKGELRKENYDACDSLICALAFININRYGVERPVIESYEIKDDGDSLKVNYKTKIWNSIFEKTLLLRKS